MRMKTAMMDFVLQNRHSMFHESTQHVRTQLNQMCRQLEEYMANRADDIFVSMRRDYMSLLGGAQMNSDAVIPKSERVMQAQIKEILFGVDDKFQAAANGEVEE